MSSPRSSALSRASKLGHRPADLVNRLEHNIDAVLMAAAVVATLVIAWMIGAHYQDDAKTGTWFEVLRHGTVAGALLLLAFSGVAWATSMAYHHADATTRMVLLALFVGVVVVFGLSMWFYFRRTDQHHVAFYLMAAVLVGALVHSYLVWRASGTMGVLGMVPAALVVVYLVFKLWPESL